MKQACTASSKRCPGYRHSLPDSTPRLRQHSCTVQDTPDRRIVHMARWRKSPTVVELKGFPMQVLGLQHNNYDMNKAV